MDFLILGVLCLISAASSHVHTAVETEMFSIPISPNLFNWTYQEFDQQYRFHASLVGKPELPTWLRYIYSRRHHSGFIFGTPPRGVQQPITLEIIGLNRQDYETRRVQITLTVLPKERMAKHEVELKIDNLNVEDLLDEHRMTRLKDILRTKLWTESSQDLYATFLASAIDMGARLPLKPEDGEGLVVRLGSASPFSGELQRLREEVRPLSRLPRCPRDYKRTTVERLFRDAGLTLDWCSFELYNTIYNSRTTQLVEYLTPDPPPESDQDRLCPWTSCDDSREKWEGQRNDPLFDPRDVWTAPSRHDLPQRSMAKTLTAAVAVPVVLLLICIATLTAVVCFHYAAISDPVSDNFLEQIFHICIDYRNRRAHKSGKVELCRYNTEQNTDQTHLANNTSAKSVGVSPNNSLARPYSPKSTTNLAGNYNRPQPPPYMGSNTNSLHHRKSTIDKTTPSTSGHTPEHRTLALEESLKLLNEANISNPVVKLLDNGTDFNIPLLKEPIVDLSNGSDDYVPIKPEQTGYVSIKPDGTGYVPIKPDGTGYVPIKPEQTGYVSIKPDGTGYVPIKPDGTGYVSIKPDGTGYVPMNADLDDIEVPDLAKFGIGAAI